MKRLYKSLALSLLALSISLPAMADSGYKNGLRRFLPKRAAPTHIEMVVGGYGDHAKRYARKDHFNPFGDFQIGIKVYADNGKVYGTQGVAGGIFSWDNFNVEVVGGSFRNTLFNRSNVVIGHPDHVPGHKIRLKISLKKLPGTFEYIELPLDFSYSYTLREAGFSGSRGWEECRVARSGYDGRDHEKCDGENGTPGHPGQPGGIGEDGAPGPDIKLVLLPYDDLNSDDMVIEARETNLRTGKTKTRWFKPKDGKLTVISRGGQGGRGGNGQPGGNGGDGGDGGREGSEKVKSIKAYGGDGGWGGPGGPGGPGGAGGQGGLISIYYHPDLANYMGSINPISVGGSGGNGGRGGDGGRAGCAGDGTKGDGRPGRKGGCGPNGFEGPNGYEGPPAEWIPLKDS